MSKAAVYHFTDGSTHRPKIYRDQLRELEEFASSKGYEVEEVFCDMSLKRSEREEFDRLLSCADQFDVIITKDLYHISKNTLQCMSILKDLGQRGVEVLSIEDGRLVFGDVYPDEALHAVTYASHYGDTRDPAESVNIRNDILSHYIRKKTNWHLEGGFSDEASKQNLDAQVQLRKLISAKKKFDVVVVYSFNDLGWRTASFCRIRRALGLDIFSLQEGFLKKGGVI